MLAVAARSDSYAQAFLNRHRNFNLEVAFTINPASYFSFVNELIKNHEGDFLVVVHDDVWLPQAFRQNVLDLVTELNNSYPAWGIVGNAGVTPQIVGFGASRIIRYLSDPHGGPNLSGKLLPAETIDGNLMLINLKNLRARNVVLPSFDGFQFYDIALSIESHRNNLGVLISPLLACYHASKGNQFEFDNAFMKSEIQNYLSESLANSQILTINGVLSIQSSYTSEGLDITKTGMQSTLALNKRTLSIVIRTRFTRMKYLNRALLSALSFICYVNLPHFKIDIHVISDVEPPIQLDYNPEVFIHFVNSHGLLDSRTLLLNWAFENISCNYLWFLDDDDFIFPQVAESLSLIMSSYPSESLIIGNAGIFSEMDLERANSFGEFDPASFESESRAIDFVSIIQGNAALPFSCFIFPRDFIRKVREKDLLPDNVVRFEDFFLESIALNMVEILPIVFPWQICAVSRRLNSEQSVQETNRDKWNAGAAEIGAYFSVANSNLGLMSLVSSNPSYHVLDNLSIQKLNAIYASTSWKITRPIRILKRILLREIKPYSLFIVLAKSCRMRMSGTFKGLASRRLFLAKGSPDDTTNRHK